MPVWVLLGFAALLLAGAGTASAADLITNNGQTTSSNYHNLADHDVAQSFTTGSTGAVSYELDSIQVRFNTPPSATATVTAIVAEGRGAGSTVVATLTNPASWANITTFTAPSGTSLDLNTTYHLIIDGSEGELAKTSGNGENTGGASGWSIGNSRYRRSAATDSGVGGTWNSSADALKIRVQGTIIPPSTEARLFSLQVTFGTFSPAFDSDTYVYDVAVGPTISQVSILPIAADGDDATIEYLTDNGNTQADADTTEPDFQRNLLVGNNVTKIKVTAEDGVTTKTYELTIIRQSTNADLSLVEIDGSALTPRFDEDTLTYTKAVPLATTQVTIQAHEKNNQQTIEFLDESDNTLTDQSTTDSHFQLNISEGDNVVKIKVTAGDGVTTKTYTITITPTAPPAVSSVAITSDPGTDKTYIIDDDIVVTLTFDKNITLTGTGANPYITVNIGTRAAEPECTVATAPTMEVVCTRTVAEGYEDDNGVDLVGNSLTQVQKKIVGPLGQIAVVVHSALPTDSDHKVDGVKPTLSRADVDQNDLTKVILTFSEVIKDPVRTKITVKKGGATQTTTVAQIDPVTQRKVTLTLMTALLSTDTDVTVDLAADAVKDVPGNGIAEVLGTSVSVEDTVAPTFVSAGTNGTDEVVLTYSEALNTTAPATSAFTVKVGGNNRGVDTVAISGSDVTLTLASAFRPGDTLTVAYSKPGTNPIKDAADNEAVSLAETTVTNNLAATAPEAISFLQVSETTTFGEVHLLWSGPPWDNGSPIQRQEVRYVAGPSIPTETMWEAIPDSAPGERNSGSHILDGLDLGTVYTFEVRAVNGIGAGGEASDTVTTAAPAWSFTLQDSNGNAVTELTEGGDSATATVSITNDVTFDSDQTVTLKWGTLDLSAGLIVGDGGATTITIPMEQASGSLGISAIQIPTDQYDPPITLALRATHGGTEIGSIDLTRVDDETVPVARITDAPATVNEGDSIDVQFTLTPPFSAGATPSQRTVQFAVTDTDSALLGPLPTMHIFGPNQASKTITLTAAENTTQNDGAHDVTFTLELNDDSPYTLGTPPAVTSVTITVRDDDTPPLAPGNLVAQAGNTEATLRWDASAASTPDHGQPVLHYEYRVKTTGGFGSWTRFPNSDADTRSHTFTGLPNDQEHTYQVRAVNVAGGGASLEKSVTPIEGVAVSFGAATLSVDEGEDAVVTLTLDEAPAAGTTVTVPIMATGPVNTGVFLVPTQAVFAADETSKSFTMHTQQDQHDRPDWVLTLSLGTLPEGYVPGTHATFVLTVLDDDHPIVSATFDAAAASVQEGTSVPVTVSLSQAPEREVVVPIGARGGANLVADEYEGVPADVTFAADETSKSFTVTFADDALREGNETLTLTFGTLPFRVDSAGENPQLVLTVTDDDGPPLAPDVSVQTGDGFAVLSWAAVQNDSPVLRYEVRWRESDGGRFNAWQSLGLEMSYRVEGLTNGRAYEFEVHAVNAHGNGEAASAPGTPTARLTGIPTAVQGLWVRTTDSSRAELSWWQPANGTDEVITHPHSTMSEIQGYRIEVCRTACDDETNWYALVPNTGKFEHRYTHQVLAPGVIRENRYRVRAININGKVGPWSNVATLDPTVLENVYLQTPDDSTLWVRFKVRNPDGNALHVRYENTGPVDARDGNTGTGAVGYTEHRLTKKGDVTLVLSGLDAGSWYRVDLDFVNTFDSERMQSHRYGTAREGETPLTSPYALDLLDAQVYQDGSWHSAPDKQLTVRMGETGRYRVRLKACSGARTVHVSRTKAPSGALRASPMDADPLLLREDCDDDDGGPGAWREVSVAALALEDYPADTRASALLRAPFAVVYKHEVWRPRSTTQSTLLSKGVAPVRILVDRPSDATLPVPAGVTIGSENRVMSWGAVAGAWGYLVEWRYGPHYRNRANQDRSYVSGTSVTLPLGGSGRGPITARVRAYSSSGVSEWSAERTWDSRPPTLNVLDTAVNEDDGSVGFLVTLDPAASGTVTVNYATVDAEAVAPADYTATSGTLTFAPGETRKSTALVPIVDDDEADSGETFRLVLSSPTGSDANNGAAVLGDAEAVATILNSEQEAASLSGFTLVDAGTNGDLMALAEGSTVRLGELLASSYGIRAEMSAGAAPGSVRLELSGAKTAAHTDDAAPWSLYGDGAGRVNGAALPPGSYTLKATAYADSGGRGEERGSLEVSFTVAAGVLVVTTPGPFTVAEGETNVTTLAASDTGTGGTASWSIPAGTAGGADGAAFALTPEGVLTLVAAKDFEAPDDADGDGTYQVTVEVREGAQSATAALSVTLADVYEAPLEVTTPGPFTVAEGTTAVAELAASDTGSGTTTTWSIAEGTAGGADGAAFALTPEGVLTLVAAKDFEAPDDADGDGVYEVTVEAAVPATVMAGAQTAAAALLVTLTDVNEAPVAVAAASPARVREGAEVTLDGSASADPDADDTLTYAWTQADDGAPRVTLSDANAVQPVFTSPSDLAAETELGFTLRVTDAAGLHAEATVTVTVTLVSEVSIAAASGYAAEGADAVFRLTRAGERVGGADGAGDGRGDGRDAGRGRAGGRDVRGGRAGGGAARADGGGRGGGERQPCDGAPCLGAGLAARGRCGLGVGDGARRGRGAGRGGVGGGRDDLVGGHDGGGILVSRDRCGHGGPLLEPDGPGGPAGDAALVRPDGAHAEDRLRRQPGRRGAADAAHGRRVGGLPGQQRRRFELHAGERGPCLDRRRDAGGAGLEAVGGGGLDRRDAGVAERGRCEPEPGVRCRGGGLPGGRGNGNGNGDGVGAGERRRGFGGLRAGGGRG